MFNFLLPLGNDQKLKQTDKLVHSIFVLATLYFVLSILFSWRP